RKSVRAELKRLHSPDADLKGFRPENGADFSVLVQAMIGCEGSEAEESFGFVVCTPGWMSRHCTEVGKPIFGSSYIVVNSFSYDDLVSAIAALCRATEGKSWNDVAEKLSRYGHW